MTEKITKALALGAFLVGMALSAQARTVESFNEDWRFTPTRSVGGGWSIGPSAGGQKVTLPHTWNASDFMSDEGYRRGWGTYTKQFDVPDEYRGKRVFVKFEGAGSMATVLVNGTIVGEHKGAYNSFTYEITPYLRYGSSNSMIVLCNNEARFDIAPQGGDFNIYGGLYRDAWLEVMEPQCITPLYYSSNGVFVHQNLVSEKRAELSVDVHLTTLDNYNGCEIVFLLQDAQGKTVASKISSSINNDRATCYLGLDNPHLWNGKDDPYLYNAVTILKKDGKEIDRVEEKIGLRYFWVDPDKGFFLNGKHLKLQGVCRHQDWLEVASALTEEHHLTDYDFFDEIGANALRLAHYPQAKFMFQEADRRGYIVWEEIPFVGSYVDHPSFDENLITQLKEMILQNYNHPSICFWGLENEIHNKIDRIVGQMNDIAHELDPGRQTVIATDQEASHCLITDSFGWNKYFGWYYDTVSDFGPFLDDFHSRYPNHKLSVSEYGGGGTFSQHVAKYGPENEGDVSRTSRGRNHPQEKQTYIHINDWKVIAERDYIWGSFVWNMFDFASALRREGDTNNQNNKGLVSQDRKERKDAFFFYKANWNKKEQTTHLCSKGYVDRAEDVTDIIVFTTDPSVKLTINGKTVGTQKTDKYATVTFSDVKLQKGENKVVVKTAKGEDSATWFVK